MEELENDRGHQGKLFIVTSHPELDVRVMKRRESPEADGGWVTDRRHDAPADRRRAKRSAIRLPRRQLSISLSFTEHQSLQQPDSSCIMAIIVTILQ